MLKKFSIVLLVCSILCIIFAGCAFADTKTAKSYVSDGKKLITQEKYQEAIRLFDQAIKLNAKYADAYLQKGIAYKDLGEYDKALVYIEKSIKLNPKFAEAYNGKAMVFNFKNNPKEAIKLCEKAIKLDPKCYDAYSNKGIALMLQGKFEESVICFDVCIKINPKYADGYSNKAFVTEYFMGNAKDGMAYYKKAEACLKTVRESFSCYSGMGDAYRRMEKFEDAVKYYDKAISTNSVLLKRLGGNVYGGKGKCLLMLANESNSIGKYREAIKCLDKGIQIFDSNPYFYLWRSAALAKLDEKEAALSDLKKAVGLMDKINQETYFLYFSGFFDNIKDMEGFSQLLPIAS